METIAGGIILAHLIQGVAVVACFIVGALVVGYLLRRDDKRAAAKRRPCWMPPERRN